MMMIYILPMMLGRTYDAFNNSVGEDIFSPEDVAAPREDAFYHVYTSTQRVESNDEARDMLTINSWLSFALKSGAVEARGVGDYLKSRARAINAIDLIIRVTYRTVMKSLSHNASPLPGWSERQLLGTHYVSSVYYGGDLLACVRFKAARAEDMPALRPLLTKTSSTYFGNLQDIVARVELLNKQLKEKVTMEISYFATVPLEGISNTIEGLRDLVENFKEHTEKVGNGIGLPAEVILADLSHWNWTQFDNFNKNNHLQTKLQYFETYLDDLIYTKFLIHAWLNDLTVTLDKAEEKQVAEFEERLRSVQRAFSKAFANLDPTKGPSQLEDAKKAYREGTKAERAWRFKREWSKLLMKIGPKHPEGVSSVYTQFGSSSCSGDEPETSLLFAGYVASSPRNQLDGGNDYLCLPQEPSLPLDTPSAVGSTIAGVKYGMLKPAPFKGKLKNTVSKGVVCAVCMVKRSTNMVFFGQKKCPDYWDLQYQGFLMSTTDHRSQNVCVDSKLESHEQSYIGRDDQSIDFAITDFATTELAFVPCVMCSK